MFTQIFTWMEKSFDFLQKILHLGNFRLEFEKTNVIFEVSSQGFFSNFHAKSKILTFRTKIALFGHFWTGIWKEKHCYIWNQHPQFIPKAEFPAKRKILKFRTNNTYLGKFELKFKTKKTIVTFEISALEFA